MTKPTVLASSIGAAGLACGALAWASSGPARAFWLWLALSCLLATLAYLGNWPGLHGKRGGRMVWWRALPALPFLLAYRIGVAVRRARRRGAAWNEVSPGLYVGERPGGDPLPPGLELIVDLTSELSAPSALRHHPGYRGLPVLDGSVPPDDASFLELVEEMAAAQGGVYVHCIGGRGRAPTAAAAVLLARGVADGPAAALELVRKGRPAARPTGTDVAFLERLAPRLLRP